MSFVSKYNGVSLWFQRKMFIHSENLPKTSISSPWRSYSYSVRHYDVVHNFLRFWKMFNFVENLYSGLFSRYGAIHNFLRFFKISKFQIKTQRLMGHWWFSSTSFLNRAAVIPSQGLRSNWINGMTLWQHKNVLVSYLSIMLRGRTVAVRKKKERLLTNEKHQNQQNGFHGISNF